MPPMIAATSNSCCTGESVAFIKSNLCHGCCFTLLRTGVAGVRAALAMLARVLATFLAASARDFSADIQDVIGKFGFANHETDRDAAECIALFAEIDAAKHLFEIAA